MIAKKHRNGKKNRDMKKITQTKNLNGIRKAAVTQTSNGNGWETDTLMRKEIYTEQKWWQKEKQWINYLKCEVIKWKDQPSPKNLCKGITVLY